MDKIVYQQALRYLARREYSQSELQRKLVSKGGDPEQVKEIIAALAENQLQSDDRFIAAFIHSRTEAGYGPRRILLELKERGINYIPENLSNENEPQWLEVLQRTWQKKFANQTPSDLKTKAKQTRFLLQKGFPPEQIHDFLKSIV